MKKYFITLILLLLCILPSEAVLKEQNLPQTLSVLRAELQGRYTEQKQMLSRLSLMNERQHEKMIAIMQKSDEIGLMLYSQKQDYTFDLTYACHEATEQYRRFNENRLPYDEILQRINTNITRYTGLIETLKQLPPSLVKHHHHRHHNKRWTKLHDGKMPFLLNKAGQGDRAACLKYALALRYRMVQLRDIIIRDNDNYNRIASKLKETNDYALKCYRDIQNSIFVNGDDSYFEILKKFGRNVKQVKSDMSDKYATNHYHVHSEWRGPIVIGLVIFVIFYFVLATILSNVIVRVLIRKVKRFQTSEFKKKKACLIMAADALLFAISIMIARLFLNHNFFIMASGLLVEYAWLLAAIFVSLLVRLKGDQIKSGFRIYFPIILVGFLVIAFRIIFIPNNLVNLIFPPILLAFTLWQWNVIMRHHNNVARSDMFYTWVSLAVMVLSCIFAWSGYVLLSVQIFIWWLFQLTAIQTITCCYDLLNMYESKVLSKRIKRYYASHAPRVKTVPSRKSGRGNDIQITWFFDLISMAVVPVASVLSVLFCIWWAADIFDLTDTCLYIFKYPFVDVKNVCQLSLSKIVLVAGMFFIFKYINYATKAFYHYYKLADLKRRHISIDRQVNFTLPNNLIAIVVWGAYFIFALILLRVPKSGISIVTAGLATGVGFAMKDLLENFFYGISLMAGRVRVGDYIECDGIRGKVDSITYQSTQIETADGSIIAFLNNSLFNKNFKNLTRNHSYELDKIPIGVAYGVNIEKVRELLLNAVNALQEKDSRGRDVISTKHPTSVIFDSFGDNCVNLSILFWVLVPEKIRFTGKVQEAVYNTLNKNHIEIPYPQRDVYIRKLPDQTEIKSNNEKGK
ncbi:mechanosensitive ion channel family protein [Prevotella cerevisiae]|uniref:Mechanosensitive ion channel family protein n=1 Tax=Segatella cerevisiae TaxID=2053716 RepID=A0ABT1BVT8_9BACT|nr:mechanosensitive ion channel family protein [Segatella cerevisiae]MCO6024925.1 mechanosensitive ion channel family protein [Segatella cerevisiae]